ncbi:hypothetical protein NV64_02735 [Erwinia sp. B116]|nr:hypothetical protein NV64_02735 [Erwinia sp. B116]
MCQGVLVRIGRQRRCLWAAQSEVVAQWQGRCTSMGRIFRVRAGKAGSDKVAIFCNAANASYISHSDTVIQVTTHEILFLNVPGAILCQLRKKNGKQRVKWRLRGR